MSVYCCSYRGSIGYGYRVHQYRWRFVPEFDQPDRAPYRNVLLEDLVFANPVARTYELDVEYRITRFHLLRAVCRLLFPEFRARTIGGLLLSPLGSSHKSQVTSQKDVVSLVTCHLLLVTCDCLTPDPGG